MDQTTLLPISTALDVQPGNVAASPAVVGQAPPGGPFAEVLGGQLAQTTAPVVTELAGLPGLLQGGKVLPPVAPRAAISVALESALAGPGSQQPLPGAALVLPGTSSAPAPLGTGVASDPLDPAHRVLPGLTDDEDQVDVDASAVMLPPAPVGQAARAELGGGGAVPDDLGLTLAPPLAPAAGRGAAKGQYGIAGEKGPQRVTPGATVAGPQAPVAPAFDSRQGIGPLPTEAAPQPIQPNGPVFPQPAVAALQAAVATRQAVNVAQGTGNEDADGPLELRLPEPVQSARWGEGLGRQVVAMTGQTGQGADTPLHPNPGARMEAQATWMASGRVQNAQLQLNPPELGPLEVRVHVQRDEASVLFHVNDQGVKAAVEAALPRLRELLADNGLNLANVDVTDRGATGQGQGESAERREHGYGGADAGSVGPADGDGQESDNRVRRAIGLIDAFA